jgi:hypothetical protein
MFPEESIEQEIWQITQMLLWDEEYDYSPKRVIMALATVLATVAEFDLEEVDG